MHIAHGDWKWQQRCVTHSLDCRRLFAPRSFQMRSCSCTRGHTIASIKGERHSKGAHATNKNSWRHARAQALPNALDPAARAAASHCARARSVLSYVTQRTIRASCCIKSMNAAARGHMCVCLYVYEISFLISSFLVMILDYKQISFARLVPKTQRLHTPYVAIFLLFT